jgi:ppGpp synthetase/RelA/SpoT-type nucleotidyltranferase
MQGKELRAEFEKVRGTYESFSEKVKELVKGFLEVQSVTVHSVSSRCKTLDSLEVKAQKKIDKGSEYADLKSVTDLAGVRVITHFANDVDRIAKIVEHEFNVDFANSIDKRVAQEPDRFGYTSLHYVVELSAERLLLSEYSKFMSVKVEIQIRSILQHAWAEIEHDIGYKANEEVPNDVKRKFSRLSGLLELADEEFMDIRKKVDKYAESVRNAVGVELEKIAIDKTSLDTFAVSNHVVVALDREIAQILSASISEPYFLPEEFEVFKLFGVGTLDQLEMMLRSHRSDILLRAKDIASNSNGVSFNLAAGICIFYLFQVVAGKTQDRREIEKYVRTMSLVDDPDFIEYLMKFS